MISFHPKYFFKSLVNNANEYEEANLVCFQVKDIFQRKLTPKFKQEALVNCRRCSSVLIYGNCGICDKNFRSLLPDYLLLEYEITDEIVKVEKKAPTVVFVIDVSGSMSNNRLDNVKEACIKTLKKLLQKSGDVKVALITFSDTAIYYGDGQFNEQIEPESAFIERETVNLNDLKSSYNNLENKIRGLVAGGGTNICKALHKAVSIGTEIVLCTDGAAQDENIEYYDRLIQFSRLHHLKINVITFMDCQSKVSVLGKFTRGTKGFLSRTKDAVDLENCLEILVHSVANFSQSTKFSLIYNQNEVKFKNLSNHQNESNNENEVFVSDKSEKWLFGVKILNSDLKEIIYQLKVFDSNKLRVLTEKKGVTTSKLTFMDRTWRKSEFLFHSMIAISITNEIIYSKTQNFNITKLYECFELDSKVLIRLFKAIEILKTKNLESLEDEEAAPIFDTIDVLKTQIFFEEFKFDAEYEKRIESLNIQIIMLHHQQLSSLIQQSIKYNETDLTRAVSETVSWSINKINAFSFDESKLLLLKELLKVVRYFLPNFKTSKFELTTVTSKKMISSKLEINKCEETRTRFNDSNLTTEVYNCNKKSKKLTVKKRNVYDFDQIMFKYTSPYSQNRTHIYLPNLATTRKKILNFNENKNTTTFKTCNSLERSKTLSIINTEHEIKSKSNFENQLAELKIDNVRAMKQLMPEIISFVEKIKETGLISDKMQIEKIYSILKILIDEEFEVAKRKYVIGMNGLTKLMAKFTINLVHIEKEISSKRVLTTLESRRQIM